MRRSGPDEPKKYNYHFKHMTTVGEPIEPEVWRWYYNVVGKGEAAIVDTWWQTENGGFLCSTIPALAPMKPGSAGRGVPGIYPIVYDDDGKEIPAGAGKAGNICIRNPWPGMMQTIWGDPERMTKVYFERYCKNKNSKDWHDWPYFAGDGAVHASDGYFRILGRIDDVINVAGHRLGTKEIESAALTVPEVAEAAVIAVPDEIKGKVPEVYVSLKPGTAGDEALARRISKAIETEISPIARPRKVWIVPDMPKTRSGKIMRRVLAALSTGGNPGDITTLANPDVVEKIRAQVSALGARSGGAAGQRRTRARFARERALRGQRERGQFAGEHPQHVVQRQDPDQPAVVGHHRQAARAAVLHLVDRLEHAIVFVGERELARHQVAQRERLRLDVVRRDHRHHDVAVGDDPDRARGAVALIDHDQRADVVIAHQARGLRAGRSRARPRPRRGCRFA